MAASGFSVAHNRLNEGLLFTKLREGRFGFLHSSPQWAGL